MVNSSCSSLKAAVDDDAMSSVSSSCQAVKEDKETQSVCDSLFNGLSWADQVELEEQMGVESRLPGRAIQLHEKLSSPARKRELEPQEAFRHHQEKQAKARVRRQMFKEEKAQKLVALNTKIEEVNINIRLYKSSPFQPIVCICR